MNKSKSPSKSSYQTESKTPVGRIEDEYKRKYQLSTNENDELKNTLFYIENKLTRELSLREEMAQKAEEDK